jgi:hypothetical protein
MRRQILLFVQSLITLYFATSTARTHAQRLWREYAASRQS